MAQTRTSIYSAAKGGIISFTRTLAAEVGKHGINVNAVSPGLVRTTRFAQAEAKAETEPEAHRKIKDYESRWVSLCALGRAGEPHDIANVVAFLVSDAASYMTGQTINVDGLVPLLPFIP